MRKWTVLLLVLVMSLGGAAAAWAQTADEGSSVVEDGVPAPGTFAEPERGPWDRVRDGIRDRVRHGMADRRADREGHRHAIPWEQLSEFRDEMNQLNELQQAWHALHIDLLDRRNTLMNLVLDAQEAGHEEALEAVKAKRAELQPIHQAMKEQKRLMHQQHREIRKAIVEKDEDAAKTAFATLIELKKELNALLKQKIEVYEEMIALLQ